MREEERRRIEKRLDQRLDELVTTRAAMRRSSEGMRDSELAHVDNHPGDLGAELHEEELDETAEVFFEGEESRIADARRALADGTYGVCWDCGREIPAERLEAMPEAVRCIDCQRHLEAGRRRAPSR